MNDPYLKKLLYKATHRGMKETDVLIGHFAQACLKNLTLEEGRCFEQFLEEQDVDILSWCLGQTEAPFLYRPLVREIRATSAQLSIGKRP
jgi:antitoxin CptB